MVRAITTEPLKFTQLDAHEGELDLANGLKFAAKSAANKIYRDYYRSSDPEYGQKIFRISDPKTNVGFYGFCYRKNESNYASAEHLALNLNGLEFVGDHETDVEIPSGGDHILILRCLSAFGSNGYSMSSGL